MRLVTALGLLALLAGCGTTGAGNPPPPVSDDRLGDRSGDGEPRADRPGPDPCARLVAAGLRRLESDQPAEARRAFREATGADGACAAAFLNLAVMDRREGDLDGAVVQVRRALALDARSVHAWHELVMIHLARSATGASSLEVAAVTCRQALQIDDTFAPLHNTCGVVDADRGRVVEALARFERAFGLDPSYFEAWMNFAQITLSFRGYGDAERAFRAALEARPHDYDALLGLGVALRGLGRMGDAEEAYERALALAPERPAAWFNLGVLHQDHLAGTAADLEQAARYYETFVEKAARDPDLAGELEAVRRCCAPRRGARRQPPCEPGRLQNVRAALHALTGSPAPSC